MSRFLIKTPRLCLGYSVSAGHFSSPTSIEIAAGAPQDNGEGKVSEEEMFSFMKVLNTFTKNID